jgi:putative heme iron utilization protein
LQWASTPAQGKMRGSFEPEGAPQMVKPTGEEVISDATQLLTQMRSIQLATLAPNTTPQASYAPFVQVDGAIYVYLSRLAQHAQNVRRTAALGAMLIRDEVGCDEIFARPRLLLECTTIEHARDSECFAQVLDCFEARFGETAATVRELTDFTLFCLHPFAARLVTGFARAVDLDNGVMRTLFGDAFDAP